MSPAQGSIGLAPLRLVQRLEVMSRRPLQKCLPLTAIIV